MVTRPLPNGEEGEVLDVEFIKLDMTLGDTAQQIPYYEKSAQLSSVFMQHLTHHLNAKPQFVRNLEPLHRPEPPP